MRKLPPIQRPVFLRHISYFFSAAFLVQAFCQDIQHGEAHQAGMTQGDVQRDANAIEAQLVELRNQMRELMPDDVATVDQAIQKLRTLSAGEMADALKALEAANSTSDQRGQLQKISDAMRSQGGASAELKKLAVDLKMRETLASMDSAVTEILRRQVSSYSETIRLGAIQQMPGDLRGNDGIRLKLAIEGQKGLGVDLKLLGKRIETLAQDIADDSKNGLVLAAEAARTRNLTGLADQAQKLIESGPLHNAAAAEMEVITTLVAMEQSLASGQDPLERLRSLAGRLEQAVADQKAIVDAVMLIGERQDLDRSFKQMQVILTDEVATLRYELEPLSGVIASLLVPAGAAGDRSLKNFKRMWEEHMDARVNTRESLDHITAGYEALKQQIAKAEATQPQTAAELAEALDILHKEVSAAAAAQAQAARQPPPPTAQQEAKVARVQDFQQRALPLSPEAATALSEAGKELAGTTPESQIAAAKSLAAAAKSLQDQKEKAEAIANAQKEIEYAQQLTAEAQGKLEKGDTPAAAADLSAAQQSADAGRKNAQEAAPAAAAAAQKAAGDLAAAKQEAGQKQGEAAESKAGDGAAALEQAAQGLAQAAAQLPGIGKGVAKIASKNSKGPIGKGNGGGGDSGDNLAGAGDQGRQVDAPRGLSPKVREAVSQLQNEKPPREFVPEVQQYFKNIADGGGF